MNHPTDSSTSRWRRLLANLGLDNKELRAWAYYDVANSSYAAVIMVAIFPIYFADVVVAELNPNEKSTLWAYLTALSMGISAILSPFLGNISDHLSAKKEFLLVATIVGALSSAALAFSGKGFVVSTSIIYIISNMSFVLGNVFYESLLVDISDDSSVHATSTSAYALGYLSSGVILAINLSWVLKPEVFGFPSSDMAIKASFISVGIWWAFFSIPLFKRVRESSNATAHKSSVPEIVKFSGRQLWKTFREIKELPNLFLFLLAFWFFSDGIGTIIKMAAIYGKEVGIGNNDLIAAIVMIQFVGVPFSFIFGPLAMKIGAKRGLYVALSVYLVVSILGYFMTSKTEFWILAFGIAMVQGAAQALSRSLFSLLVPPSRSGEFFGFYSVSSKFAGIFGPLMFGLVSQLAGESRLSILFIGFLFIAGMALLSFVDIEKGRWEALQADGADRELLDSQ